MLAALILAAPFLTMEVPTAATQVQFQRRTLAGVLDPGYGRSFATQGLPIVYRFINGFRGGYYHVTLDFAGAKDYRYESRWCGNDGCHQWTPEVRLTCECWTGKAGCPTTVLATTPTSGACP